MARLRLLFSMIVLALLVSFAACSNTTDSAGAAGEEGEETPDVWAGKDDSASKLAYNSISKREQFEAMAFQSGGTVTLGRSLKFLIDYRKTSSPKLRFMNANYTLKATDDPNCVKYHYYFAKAVLTGFNETIATFNESTYKASKRFYAGTIQEYRLGGPDEILYGIQFYPEDTVAEKDILTGVKIVRKAFTIPGAKVAFVATGPQQTAKTIGDALAAIKVENLTIDQVLGAINFMPMNLGEAWGYLRIFPANSDKLTPTDIPVFDQLPLDLAVVAGTITRAVQDASSHVNLKSKERNTANMVLRDAGPDHAQMAALADKPVHLAVRADGFVLEESTDAEVQKKYAERVNKPWSPLQYEPETKLLAFTEMCPTSADGCFNLAKRYGSKAANLGFLVNKSVLGRTTDSSSLSAKYGYDLVPGGIGVPIQYYHDLVGYGPNQTLRDKLKALIDAEKAGTLTPDTRQAAVQQVQQLFYAAQFPPGVIDKIKQKLTSSLPLVKSFKVRSSANAEDLPNFDGAGLYDSFSAKLSAIDNPDGSCAVVANEGDVETKLEISPKTIACALKGAYASTWNVRAIAERSFARLDHATAGMGIAINAKYDRESPVADNSVAVTRVIGSEGVAGYTFASQQGNNLVTNPTPGTVAETVVAAFSGEFDAATFMVLRYATPAVGQPPLTQTVLTQEQMARMLEITRQVESTYCKSKQGYYEGDCAYVAVDPEKPRALDLEFKILENGHFVSKQVREFAGH
ncbi:MAG: hypothetical protein HY898_17280 [Deltaproteobacteria bacterium]|nr:hypothetical protein [Deltaproteobacteria bacterium]